MSNASSDSKEREDFGTELDALKSVLDALGPLQAGAREFVIRTAVDRLKIAGVHGLEKEKSTGGGRREEAGSDETEQSLQGIGPKEFLRMKKPVTELQRMVCLAFYLTHARSTPHFKTADLTALNTEAAGGNFSNPSATVRNATNQSRFLAPAGKAGAKQITALGEDYVNALPDQEAAKAAAAAHRPSRRKPSKKNGARKE